MNSYIATSRSPRRPKVARIDYDELLSKLNNYTSAPSSPKNEKLDQKQVGLGYIGRFNFDKYPDSE